MKNCRMFIVGAITAFLLAVCVEAEYTSPNTLNASGQVVIKGKVEVCKDPSGLITSVRILTRNRTYFVILDDNGNFLGRRMCGKRAVVVGWLNIAENERWLSVGSFAEEQKW
jgi:hypothetical protein